MSLRTRLFIGIAAVAALSVAVAFTVGAYLSRRTVEENTLRDVAAQADLLAERERASLLPFRGLRSLEPFLERQGQRVVKAPLDGSSPYLPADRAAELRRGQAARRDDHGGRDALVLRRPPRRQPRVHPPPADRPRRVVLAPPPARAPARRVRGDRAGGDRGVPPRPRGRAAGGPRRRGEPPARGRRGAARARRGRRASCARWPSRSTRPPSSSRRRATRSGRSSSPSATS